jgi:uncharacterized protein YecE (DUF72 family)
MADIFPSEPIANFKVLKPHNEDFKLYFGLTKWGRHEWAGTLYPAGTIEKDFFGEYLKHFNSIEFNPTHYKTYPPEDIKKWADKAAGKDFIFCPKFPKSISHNSSFTDVEDQTEMFFESVRAFGNHLGPIFLQVNDKFSPKRKVGLFNYLVSLPKDLQFFLDVRNPEWFHVTEHYENLLRFLGENNIGAVIIDLPGRIVKLGLTIPKCFIRYMPGDDKDRIVRWFEKIKEWQNRGLKEAYFFVHSGNENALRAVEELQRFKELVEQA